jgi:glycosyltransferase involved in cell wall biosynthesis
VPAPNLLQIVPSLAGSGLGRATLDTAQAVTAAGGKAIVASPGGSMVPDLLRLRATHLELPQGQGPLWARLTLPGKLAASLRDSDVDIVQARSPLTAWIAGAVARRLDARWIATLHRPLEATSVMGRMIERRLSGADAVIAVSEHVARSARERLPAARDRLSVIPPGIRLDRFDPAIVRADRVIKLAQELRLPDDQHIVLYPTRFDEDRGQKILIAAMKRLRRDDVFCLMLGSSGTPTPFEKELEGEIARANLLGHVQIGPYVDDMPAAYMLADVVVATGGAHEGFSRTLVEAQAMGRPVLAEEGGGAAEALLPGTTGWLAEANNAGSLAGALAAALSLSPQARVELARAAQNHVRERYDLVSTNRQLLQLYNSLAG